MDNLTHSLIGLTAAKAGLEKLSPGTSALCILAANAPDADIVSAFFGGRWVYLNHHRGITHSIVGTLTLALLLPLIFYLGDRLLARLRNTKPQVKLKGLIVASLIVSATHPLMDWTNNYGVRFLLPWSSRWFYGDLVFIIDPVLWILLGGATFLVTSNNKKQMAFWFIAALIPSVLVFFGPTSRGGLANATALRIMWIAAMVTLVVLFWRRVGDQLGARIPLAALGICLIYISGLAVAHSFALHQAKSIAARIAGENSEQVLKVAAMPTLANPTSWQGIFQTERAAYRFDLSLLGSGNDPRTTIRHQTPAALSVQARGQALRDGRTHIFLDFARFPVARVTGEECLTQTLVQFADLRYTEPGRDRGTFSLEVPIECPALDD